MSAGPSAFTRRTLLRGAAGAALFTAGGSGLLTACGGGSSSAAGAKFLVPFFATGEDGSAVLRTGIEQRMPWGLADRDGVPLRDSPGSVTMTIADHAGSVIGAPIDVARHGDGTPQPYYPLRTTLSDAGAYTVTVEVAGSKLDRNVVFASPDKVPLVQPGERAIPVVTPTPSDHRGVEPICTRTPPCPLHELTLSDALSNGRPTAFLISTPAFCQTAVCGPVLELLLEEAPTRPINAVHAEVYTNAMATGDPLQATLAEAVTAYKLSFEPSLLVADGNGIVTDRLDFVFDRTELRQALDKVT
jgi:hypothetical protein